MTEAKIERIYETVIYGRNLDAMAGFYADVLGLRLVEGPDELAATRLEVEVAP